MSGIYQGPAVEMAGVAKADKTQGNLQAKTESESMSPHRLGLKAKWENGKMMISELNLDEPQKSLVEELLDIEGWELKDKNPINGDVYLCSTEGEATICPDGNGWIYPPEGSDAPAIEVSRYLAWHREQQEEEF